MPATLPVTIRTNAPQVTAALLGLARSQIPFATAVALTRTAQDGRDEVRANMGQSFTIRSPRPARGVTIERARKNDKPIHSKVGTRDKFMAEHVTGALRTATKARRISVPMRIVARNRTASGKIKAGQRPRRILSKKGAGVAQTSLGSTVLRGTRGRGQSKGLRRMFFFRRFVTIDAGWPFEQQVRGRAAREYGGHFRREFRAASRTAGRKAKLKVIQT